MTMGLNYAVDGTILQIFGAEGMELKNGQWLRNSGRHNAVQECDPCSETMDLVNTRIEEIVESGQGDKIAQLQLGSHEAVTLFLEGILTAKHFSRAYEEQNFVILPEIKIPYSKVGGLWLIVSVRISSKEHCISLLDSQGNAIIPVAPQAEEDAPDDFVDLASSEIIFAAFDYEAGYLPDTREDGMIEALEQGRFAWAA